MIPKTPPGLSKEARILWKNLTEEYGIEDSGGLAILTTGLRAYDRAAAACAQIKADGMMPAGAKHPLLSVERDSNALWLSAIRQLNLDVMPVKAIGRPAGR